MKENNRIYRNYKNNNRTLSRYLREMLTPTVQSDRMQDTIVQCKAIVKSQDLMHCDKRNENRNEERTGFLQFLSDVFRYEGADIIGLQTTALCIVCCMVTNLAELPAHIPILIPIFVFFTIPFFLRNQMYGMKELETVTRASMTELVLAKLILTGAAHLVCITILLILEFVMQNSYILFGQMILYCIVPYLVCMAGFLRIIRVSPKETIPLCVSLMLMSCLGWGVIAKVVPWLYELSAIGIWIVAFLVFSGFFIREIGYIVKSREEGTLYGISA